MGLWTLFVIILINSSSLKCIPVSSQQMQHQLFEVYDHIEQEMVDKFNHCSSFTFILEVKAIHFVEYQWSAHTNNIRITKQDSQYSISSKYGANLILDLDNGMSNNFTLEIIPHIYKFHYTCSVSFYNINNFLQLEESELESHANFASWQGNLLKIMPNPLYAFCIFFTTIPDIPEKIRLFSKISSVIRFNLFIVFHTDAILVYKASLGVEKSLVQIASHENNLFKKNDDFLPTPQENFENQVINVVVCPMCTDGLENFHKTGIWEDAYMAVTYEALGRFNVSFETSSAMGIPTGDQNEDGEWDDFTNPLVDGSSAVSTVIKPTYLKGEVIYLTKDYMHDSAIFISAPPLQTKFGSLSVLKDPLEYEVWMGFLISISSMIAVLQAIIYLRIGKLAYRTIAQIVLYPILDQMAFTHQSKSGFSKDRVVNVMVGTWYLSLIVLACAYKSKLISAIVCPHYITRPQNFAELAASKYDIGIVFYTGFLENDFRELNTSVNAEIARRAVEYDYLAEDCYQKIFEGDNVCIGYTMAMEAIGGEFLMDINGQKMYALSKDSHFQGLMVLGVSKYYPMFLAPINFYLSLSQSVGLTQYYTRYFKQKVQRKGKENALKWQHTKKYYAGNVNVDREDQEDRQFSAVLKKLLCYCLGACIVLFCAEKTAYVLLKCFQSGRVVQISDHNDKIFQNVHPLHEIMERNIMLELFSSKKIGSLLD